MFETLQGSAWFMVAAFGSGIILFCAAAIKGTDKGAGTALPVAFLACLAFGAGFTAMSKTDDMSRDWFNERNDPTSLLDADQPAQ